MLAVRSWATSASLDHSRYSTLVRYLVALTLTAAAAALRFFLPSVLSETPYLAFYPAVVAAAAFGGTWPGLLATVVSALCVDLLFDATPGWIDLRDPVVIVRLLIFMAGGTGISIVSGLRRTARRAEKQRTDELAASEMRFRGTFENAAVGISHTDADGRWIAFNDRLRDLLGYSRDELLKLGLRQVTHQDDLPEDWGKYEQLMRGEIAAYRIEKRYLRKDGTAIWMEVHRALQSDRHGRPAYSINVAQDITQRRQADEALRRSREQLRLVMDTVPALISYIGSDYRYRMTNRTYEQWFGRPRENIYGHHVSEVLGQAAWAQTKPYMDRALAGELVSYERLLTYQTGARWIRATYAPDRDADGHVHGVVALVTDISERKAAEEELRAAHRSAERAKEAAEHANLAKDHFLAVLSHELRNPLTPVLTTATMLHEDPSTGEEVRQQMEVIRRNAELEARLIDDLLDVTRISRGKIELFKTRCELGEVIKRAVEVCQPDIDARQIHFTVDWGKPPYWIDADMGRLQQVFWNLIKNAVKFTPHGGCVSLKCSTLDGHVVVDVQDSGIGIEAEALPRLFNAFEQAERSITRQFGGLGLGLTISKSLVELHGGTIEAQSEGKGQGATFRVSLPLQSPAPAAVRPATIPPGQPAKGEEQKPLRILLVEDHGDTARVMQRLLQRDGHEAQTAGDISTAMEALAGNHFDLLLSDLGLPDGSGLDLLREVRQHGNPIPAIALSGYGQEQDIERSHDAGFAAHITKPANPDQLRQTIARVSQRQGR